MIPVRPRSPPLVLSPGSLRLILQLTICMAEYLCLNQSVVTSPEMRPTMTMANTAQFFSSQIKWQVGRPRWRPCFVSSLHSSLSRLTPRR